MTGLLYGLYFTLATLALPLILLFAAAHIMLRPSARAMYRQRLVCPPPSCGPKTRPRVWIHAACIGEVLSCRALVAQFTGAGHETFFSTGTREGLDTVARHFPAIHAFYLPLDHPWILRRAFRATEPDLLLICEMEIWPALARVAKQSGIPVFLINGRMPERDCRIFRRLRFFYGPVLSQYDGLLMQAESDAVRMRQICDHPNLRTLGDMKFDSAPAALSPELAALLPEGTLLCGASTHDGDEETILEAFLAARRAHPGLRLVLAPKNTGRAREIAALVSRHGCSSVLRTTGRPARDAVFILDTVGELAAVYERCTIAILGGTFSRQIGGHNLIEPALHGVCILCGPHMENFQDTLLRFQEASAVHVTDRAHLRTDLSELLSDPDRILELGRRAKQLVASGRGAAHRIFDAITVPVQHSAPNSSGMAIVR